MEYIIIFCTTNSFDNAKLIGKTLVEQKLAACTNIIPKLTSIYSWKDEIVEDEECLLIIKTKKKLFNDVKAAILKLHPYEVAEIISLDIKDGANDYLEWINTSTIS